MKTAKGQKKRLLLGTVICTLSILIAACSGPSPENTGVTVSYQPLFIPVRVSVDNRGRISVSAEQSIATQLGVFSVGAYTDPSDYFDVEGTLTVRLNGEDTIYGLASSEIDVRFESGYYETVRLVKIGNNWVLELRQSVGEGLGNVVTNNSSSTCQLPDGEPITAEVLARRIGGEAQFWTARGNNCVWGYWHKDVMATFRHPGDNTILTYWKGFAEPRNARGCWIVIPATGPDSDGDTRTVQCPDAGAEFEADGIGFHPNP